MNIFNYFKKAGIDTIDASFYRKIAEWVHFRFSTHNSEKEICPVAVASLRER